MRIAARSPTGALTKKTQRQPMVVVMMLPIAGPITAAAPHTPENSPWILARCSLSKTSPRMVNEIGCTAPAPRPWIVRKRIRDVIDVANPHSIDPPMKRPSPVMKMGLRPYMSARRAYSGTVTVEASRYAEKTQLYSDRPPRLPMIVGIAVETTVPSRAATARADMIPAATTNCSGVMPICRATAWWRRVAARVAAGVLGMRVSLGAGRIEPRSADLRRLGEQLDQRRARHDHHLGDGGNGLEACVDPRQQERQVDPSPL